MTEVKITGLMTFGFMDPDRGNEANAELLKRLRSVAIKGFADEHICNLASFADDPLDDCHGYLSKGIGKTVGGIRDGFYSSLAERNTNIELLDVQSYFLFAFTKGINEYSVSLLNPDEIVPPKPITSEQILNRRFPIRGPEWVCDAANREMEHIANVFCDLQNEFIVPLAKKEPYDAQLISDVIAGAFFWAYFAGIYWFQEAVKEIRDCLSLAGGRLDPSEPSMYQVRRAMLLIPGEDVKRVLKMADAFQEEG